ncbi:MAG: phosphonate ABC transporter ATP-binding protein [Cytophagales bacterium]|nr:phosphonate ABC transporter ATP-binding protein [Cytophagales bacterium]
MNILEIENLVKTYPNGVSALKGISFKVKKGEFLVIIGLSGSGKSTLLRCINRLHDPTSGKILFDNQDITNASNAQLRHIRKNIGMIFQHFNLIPGKSVLDNVLSGTLGNMNIVNGLLGIYAKDVVEDAMQKIAIVGLTGKEHQRADKLSGGQQQRVAIARTLMQKPQILLADEPVASLDPATSHSVMQYLEKINKELGVTVICNLHFLSLVRQYASAVVALKGGELVYEGLPNEIDENWFKKIYGDDAVEVTID